MKLAAPRISALLFALPVLVATVGCTDSTLKQTYLEDTYVDRAPTGTVDDATAAYQVGDHATAYAIAKPISADYINPRHEEAAFIAGLSAYAMGNLGEASQLLRKAQASKDAALAADAAAQLGLVYSAQGRYPEAQDTLLWAAERLQGESKAQAFYYAGIAQQKRGQWSQARATLYNALRHTTQPATEAQIREQLATTGWTLQVGAFGELAAANTAAQNVNDPATRLGLGQPRLVASTDANGRPLTLVQVGTFTSYQSAARFRDNLGTAVIIKPIAQ